MIVSRNEIESLALKAARGAGMSWGLAEEAAVAAGWLAEQALPWAETLAGVLAQAHATSPPQIEGQRIVPARPGKRLCPILTGALLSDLGPPASAMEVRDVLAPLWLAPFLASWAGPDRAVHLAWGKAHLWITENGTTGADAIPTTVLAAAFADSVAIAFEQTRRPEQPRPHREPFGYDVADDVWRALEAFEHRTYVPASAQSRLVGAGAGLLDND
jgi:hypothetical protein